VRGRKQPAGENLTSRQRGRFPGHRGEHDLRNILRAVPIAAALAQRDSMDESEMTTHQLAKRLLITLGGVAGKQFGVIGHGEKLLLNRRRCENRTEIFKKVQREPNRPPEDSSSSPPETE
jgi:hypothetical protein